MWSATHLPQRDGVVHGGVEQEGEVLKGHLDGPGPVCVCVSGGGGGGMRERVCVCTGGDGA